VVNGTGIMALTIRSLGNTGSIPLGREIHRESSPLRDPRAPMTTHAGQGTIEDALGSRKACGWICRFPAVEMVCSSREAQGVGIADVIADTSSTRASDSRPEHRVVRHGFDVARPDPNPSPRVAARGATAGALVI
jgi:hypothetical protein